MGSVARDEEAPAQLEATDPAREAAAAAEAPHVVSIDPKEVASSADGGGPDDLDERSGLPKVLRSYVVVAEPRLSIVPGFVSDAEIEHLLGLGEGRWEPSVVGRGVYRTGNESKDLTNRPSPNRTSYSCMLKSAQTPTVRSIEHRLARLAGLDVDYLERLNLVRYAPGQFFNLHHDGRFRPRTVFIYLNDLPGGGGETFFPELGAKVVPRKGCAATWSNVSEAGVEDKRVYHIALPPKSGMKYGIACFFNNKPLKRWEDVDSDFGQDGGDQLSMQPAAGYHTIDPNSLLDEAKDPETLHSFTVCREPKVSVIPGVLTKEEADLLIGMLGPEDGRPAGWSEVCGRIEVRLAAIAGLPTESMDALRVSKCEPGMTPDGQFLYSGSSGEGPCRIAILLFLNDVCGGGELRFPGLGLQVKPRMGCAVAWSPPGEGCPADRRAAAARHRGRPPRAGASFVALAAFRGPAGPAAPSSSA